MNIINIAAYKFIELGPLTSLRESLQNQCRSLQLKGTILLSQEGINLFLAGREQEIICFMDSIRSDARLSDMIFKESITDYLPFNRLKVKIKKEIITMGCSSIHPEKKRAPSISPTLFKQWLDEKRDMVVLDTRNDYEVRFGTFENAMQLHTSDFSEFPKASKELPSDKPIVMFCTGGIRCEKAALHLLEQGHDKVYQLDGGILNYFKEVGGDYFNGDCFVFDQRIALNPQLQESGVKQCSLCEGPAQGMNKEHGFVANLVCHCCQKETV